MIPKKSTTVDKPYQVWKAGEWTWAVLKSYQNDDSKPYARWYCAVSSPFTFFDWEYGDCYVSDVKGNAKLVEDNTND
jgi:hypothetical protein